VELISDLELIADSSASISASLYAIKTNFSHHTLDVGLDVCKGPELLLLNSDALTSHKIQEGNPGGRSKRSFYRVLEAACRKS
jgi:hypothetical protein